MNRTLISARLLQLGREVAALKQELLENKCVYTAGLLRAVEEALNVVYSMFNDPTVPQEDL